MSDDKTSLTEVRADRGPWNLELANSFRKLESLAVVTTIGQDVRESLQCVG